MGFFSHTWIGCLLAALPGPPRVKVDNAQFRLFPVDKTNKYCPEVEGSRDVGFYLFSREFPEEPHELRLGKPADLAFSNLDFSLTTVIYFPPFFDGVDGRNVREVKEGYLRRGGYNLIVVGFERLSAGPWYPAAVTNTFVVGKQAAAFADYLVGEGLPLKNLRLQGLSIGAHAAGVAGRHMGAGRPPRITGLDPASFLFVGKHRDMRLDSSDADFVDVIHTDGLFGMFYPIGHVDFFVDPDFHPQPGCEIENILGRSRGLLFAVFCDHLRSNKLFARSITHPTLFPGKKCSTWKGLRSGFCRSDSVEFMGLDTPSTARGIYLENKYQTVILDVVKADDMPVRWNISTDHDNSSFGREYKYPMYEDVAPVHCDCERPGGGWEPGTCCLEARTLIPLSHHCSVTRPLGKPSSPRGGKPNPRFWSFEQTVGRSRQKQTEDARNKEKNKKDKERSVIFVHSRFF